MIIIAILPLVIYFALKFSEPEPIPARRATDNLSDTENLIKRQVEFVEGLK